mgnify:CR=1 FL=1|jgi:hypothetical protein
MKSYHIKAVKYLENLPGHRWPNRSDRSVEHNQKILLKMADEKKPRPKHNTKIGKALIRYTTGNNRNSNFDIRIREKIPEWFISQSDIANQKKQMFLDMASRGEPRPSSKTKMGKLLYAYLDKNHHLYDEDFESDLSKFPEWIIKVSERVAKNKSILLEMAESGKPKPKRGSSLRNLLDNYMRDDDVFRGKIIESNTAWAPKAKNEIEQKKQLILNMARNNEPKPNCNSALGQFLRRQMKRDKKFAAQVRLINPNWAAKRSNIAPRNKAILSKMARRGDPRPKANTKLGGALHSYTTIGHKAYDSSFDKSIRFDRKNWFRIRRKNSDKSLSKC